MIEITARQLEVLNYVKQFMADEMMPPTCAEIATHFKFRSAYSAQCHLKALERKGQLILIGGRARGIRIPKSAPVAFAVPEEAHQ